MGDWSLEEPSLPEFREGTDCALNLHDLVVVNPVRSRELNLMILMDPFQPQIFYDPMIFIGIHEFHIDTMNIWSLSSTDNFQSCSFILQLWILTDTHLSWKGKKNFKTINFLTSL